uniref:Glutamate-gated chloride channel n=1 Tax=Timema shepardi TaxID=629360 RepID=A0A7R9AXN4_TIMSH|nr:unnamed protein product [Timema shepardi]
MGNTSTVALLDTGAGDNVLSGELYRKLLKNRVVRRIEKCALTCILGKRLIVNLGLNRVFHKEEVAFPFTTGFVVPLETIGSSEERPVCMLNYSTKADLVSLIEEFPDVVTNNVRRTDVVTHSIELDDLTPKYEVEFLLQQQWFDPRLRYNNQSNYDFLNAIHHHDKVWLPDTYFIMHGDFKDPLIPVHFALRIYRNGTVNYLMRRHLILSCQGHLHIFPFDDPTCSFAMESKSLLLSPSPVLKLEDHQLPSVTTADTRVYKGRMLLNKTSWRRPGLSYEQSAIRYVWKNDEDTLRKSPSLSTLNAYLISNHTIPCPFTAYWRGNYSCLKVELIFTRDRSFYFTTVFIPGIILVTSSFITFWLEWNAVPARVMIGVTTMLNFFTTSNGFRSTLPVVSNLTAMNVWDGVCMCFIYASLLEFVCVNYVGRKRPLHNVVYRPGENPVTQRRMLAKSDWQLVCCELGLGLPANAGLARVSVLFIQATGVAV